MRVVFGSVMLYGGSEMYVKQQPHAVCKSKLKFSHTRYRALGPELTPVYTQSARR